MRPSTLIKNNLSHYWRTNLAVILGVAIAVAVLAGALLVGDSVRASLRELALSRLGRTDFVLTSPGFFRQQLADDLQAHSQFTSSFISLAPIIALEGVVTRDENRARAGGVHVFGIDDRFWRFHGESVEPLDGDGVYLSQSLAHELGAQSGDAIILRIEKPSAIPAESLHGSKDDPGRSIRLTIRRSLPRSSLGEFSLRPQQGAVRALFVSLRRLQRDLGQMNRINTILLSAKIADERSAQSAESILKEKFTLSDLGLKLRNLPEQKVILLESDSAVITDQVAEKVKATAVSLNHRVLPVLTYLANTIRIGEKSVPYSLVTALDDPSRTGLEKKDNGPPPIVINDWAARDLGARVGDQLEIEYYLWAEEGRLTTSKQVFRVDRIVPIEGFANDRNYAPDYPGITDTDSLSDWDPPFPIDLSRVRPKDEEYWNKYRATPKAFIRLDDGQKLWASRYGKLTSIRIIPPDGLALEDARSEFERHLRDALDPVQMGFSIQPVKEQGMQASRGATDFGEYFTYFSFFLVVSALLLTTLFFKLGIEQRLREIGVLRAFGYSIPRIRSLFLREGLALAVIGSMIGVLGAIAYGGLMMWGLRTWWVSAVGTTLLRLHITPGSLAIGAVAGIITALVCIWWTLRRLTPASPRSLLAGSAAADQWSAGNQSRKKTLYFTFATPILFGAMGLLLLLASATKVIGQVGGFFGAGTLLMIAIICFWTAWLRSARKRTIDGQGLWSVARLGFRNTSSRPGRSVLCIALIASAAFIIVSVDAFRRDPRPGLIDKRSGDGGYSLLAESLLPIVRDPNNEREREELNLNDELLGDVKLTRFRLRPGDDASCLNLYQPRNPRILAPTGNFIDEGRFAFNGSLAATPAETANPWLLLNQQIADAGSHARSIVPVIVDKNSLDYVLHLKLGDELIINASDGTPVRLRVVAALSDSIFQSDLLISEENFLRLFPDQDGFRFFLIDAPLDKSSAVAAFLEDRLSDFGFDATGTGEKLAAFHEVENTYLSTFQALGGLGLLLGTLGLAVVLLRNVIERRRELALMRAIGYRRAHLGLMVVAENALMLGCGLLTGVMCALLAITPALIARGGRLSAVSLGLLVMAVLVTGLAASLIAVRAVVRAPVLPALRTE
ncbi:MAG: FtsX-like permease family protein [Acidobacteria bacterium]|nr:FtsX-like permease family protein [Acidobacteriota bacterium]